MRTEPEVKEKLQEFWAAAHELERNPETIYDSEVREALAIFIGIMSALRWVMGEDV